MVKYLTIRVVGACLLALYTGIDAAFNISGIVGFGSEFIPLITFVVFIVVIFWIIYDLKKANDHLLDTHPSIEVYTLISPYGANYLVVKNVGEWAEFSANIEISFDFPIGNIFNTPTAAFGAWENTHDKCMALNKGQSALLRIAQLEIIEIIRSSENRVNWCLYYCQFNGERYETRTVKSISWVRDSNDNTNSPDISYRVIITSNPSLRHSFDKEYKLTLGGLREIKG